MPTANEAASWLATHPGADKQDSKDCDMVRQQGGFLALAPDSTQGRSATDSARPSGPVLTAVLVPMTALLLAWAAWVIMALMLANGSGLGLAAAAKQDSTHGERWTSQQL